MRKYRSIKAPAKESSVAESNPGFWADHIKQERNIRSKWDMKYGHLFHEKELDPSFSGTEPHEKWVRGHGAAEKVLLEGHRRISGPGWSPKRPIPQVTSNIREVQQNSVLMSPIGKRAGRNVEGYKQAMTQGHEVKASKMNYNYVAPRNTHKHVAEDHVTACSSSFGHHGVPFRIRSQMPSRSFKTPTSANDFYLQIRSSKHNEGAPHNKQPADHDKSKQQRGDPDKSDGISDISKDLVSLKLEGRVGLDALSMQRAGCTWDEFQRSKRSLPGPICPKCENRLGCTCVPRRREKIPEDPGTSPDEELPPWPPQVWCGPTYNGSRIGTLGDILRLRYRLSRDPEWKTPMNRMYDEMKAVNYYGKGQHAGEDSFSCGVCRTACEAGRGTWFDEQLRKGNPFTTGDTQFKSSMYSRKP